MVRGELLLRITYSSPTRIHRMKSGNHITSPHWHLLTQGPTPQVWDRTDALTGLSDTTSLSLHHSCPRFGAGLMVQLDMSLCIAFDPAVGLAVWAG